MASSPLEETPELLTPRTKIRALLATVDSDEEGDGNDAEPSGDAEMLRPRGKLASRMQGDGDGEVVGVGKGGKTASDERALDGEKNDADDDDDFPVMPRRVNRRLAFDTPQKAVRSPSPGLFVSSPAAQDNEADSDSDLPAVTSASFTALVERKRQERLAREAEQAERAESEDSDGITDDDGGRTLTQMGARPARKASKKAIEEMNRETQRMLRNRQLTLQPTTKKTFTKEMLFAAMGYGPDGRPAGEDSSSRPPSPRSDVVTGDAGTPPSSPPVVRKAVLDAENGEDEDDDELLSLEQIADGGMMARDKKGKGKAVASPKPKRRIRVRLPAMTTTTSDDELQVMNTTTNTKDKQSAQEERSLRTLRILAQVRSPGRKKQGASMTAMELSAQLRRRAKEQARRERERRVDMLKKQGVVVQTAEEREREQLVVEDLVAKAREEGRSKKKRVFDRRRTEARGLVVEQAVESDDEYAGVGGEDGEDSDDESSASMRDLLDDQGGVDEKDVDRLAAFDAQRTLAANEAQIAQLYKDITTGALRRKRPAAYTLSDSDSETERRRRQRVKQRRHAKMRSALYADERVKDLVEGGAGEAFVRSMQEDGLEDTKPNVQQRLAFTTTSTQTFKVPPLLRRATTNSTHLTDISTTTTTMATTTTTMDAEVKIRRSLRPASKPTTAPAPTKQQQQQQPSRERRLRDEARRRVDQELYVSRVNLRDLAVKSSKVSYKRNLSSHKTIPDGQNP
ncbi:hypothetical protein CDD80_3722 [Ophiocordyceps camponoti-rufipedis]|uniref:DNA replication checkpoint mediator MRC1 domain-containing protein n=1 Tax=Ophiocordyceps camponoti-rufipedis TaxID=2004952 RepID=A0A2C5Z2I9_9HYPO|nr:hypothetical protein CDD80_3722 [Ophiocordyceps camponoti-rufipedis]